MGKMLRQSLVAYAAPLCETVAPCPEPRGAEVLVRIARCGVCHSDLHMQDGYFTLAEDKRLDVTGGRTLPFTLGHEIAGTIERAGPEAEDAVPGRVIAVYPWIGCGACAACAVGNENICAAPRHLGITVDGGFASHVLVPHPRYLIDAGGVEPAIAGSYMCSGLTAFSALKKAALAGDGPLLIIGLGGVGLMALELARSLTHRTVVAADIEEGKRQLAEQNGADLVIDPRRSDARQALFAAMGRMAAAIDFVGSAESLDFAQAALGKAGIAIVVGLMGGRIALPVPMFPLRQLSIIGSFVGSLPEARELMGLVRDGRVKPIPITVRALEEANSAVDRLRSGRVIGRLALKP